MGMRKKVIVCLIANIFLFQVANANPIIWQGLRWLLGASAKQAVKKTVKSKVIKKVVKSAITGATITSIASIGNAQESDFLYNQHGLQLYENGNLIYVGVGCDVESKYYGNGHWSWNDNGWVIGMENSEQITYFEYDYSNLPDFSESVMKSCKSST